MKAMTPGLVRLVPLLGADNDHDTGSPDFLGRHLQRFQIPRLRHARQEWGREKDGGAMTYKRAPEGFKDQLSQRAELRSGCFTNENGRVIVSAVPYLTFACQLDAQRFC